jgi:hypothetical protein
MVALALFGIAHTSLSHTHGALEVNGEPRPTPTPAMTWVT